MKTCTKLAPIVNFQRGAYEEAMKKRGLIFFVALALLLPATWAWGHEPGKEQSIKPQGAALRAPGGDAQNGGSLSQEPTEPNQHDHDVLKDAEVPYIGIEEQLGGYVPLDLTFVDSDGREVSLKELIDRPTIVSFVYYSCTDVCPLLLSGVAEVLGKLDAVPGEEYRALAVSFDELDTPADAAKKKRDYLKAIEKPYPPEAWRFLTGDRANIKKFTDAAGFRFQRKEDVFHHSVTLVILSGEGKIIRYLYGKTFLPFDLKMALAEASEGRPGPTITKFLQYCFTYDPKGKRYVFNILKVFGTAMLVFLGGLFIFLTRTGKRRIQREG